MSLGRTRKTLLRLTKDARKGLELQNRGQAKESLTHKYWKRWYARHLDQQGYTTRLEAPRVGGRVDALARKGDKILGVEIETGKSDIISNIKNGLLTGFTRMLIVATNERAMSKIQIQLAKCGLLIPKRVRVVLKGNL